MTNGGSSSTASGVLYAVERFAEASAVSGKARREIGRRVATPVQRELAIKAETERLDTVRTALRDRALLPEDAPSARAVAEEFETAYARRPLADNTGGTMRNSAFWLYGVAALLRPSAIIESGTYLGSSSWVLRQAAPDARVITYDITRHDGRISDPTIEYRIGDWSEMPATDIDPARTLCVFDDHISHLRRLSEARNLGIRMALLDDDYPAHALYATGSPPVPTLAMLTASSLGPNTELVWERDGKRYRYVLSAADLAGAKTVIDWTLTMPNLSEVNYFVQQAPMTFAALRGKDPSG
jgi:hypothetical protein